MADIIIIPGSSIMSFTSSANYTQTLTQDASGSLVLQGSGSTGRTDLFTVNGNNGTLFSVSDDLSDSLFSVNTIAGLPVIEAFANNTVTLGKYGQNDLVVTGSRVGIGTSAPSSKLHLQGTTTLLTITDTSYNRTSNIGYADSANLYFANDSNSNTYIGAYNNLFLAYGGGNVGVGTTSPSVKLDVVGTGHFGSPITSDQGLGIYSSNGNDSYSRIRFYQSSTNIHTIHSFSTSWQGGTIYNASAGALNLSGWNGITIGSWNDADAIFVSGGVSYFKNNVGIGTTTPSAKLHVDGTVITTSTLNDTDGSYAIDHPGINTWKIGVTSTNSSTFHIGNDTGGSFANKIFNVTAAGNVGIGVTNPSYKLQVQGTAYINSTLYVNGATTIEDTFTVKTQDGSYTVAAIDYSGAAGGRIKVYTDGVLRTQIGSYYGDETYFNVGYGGNVGIGLTNPSARLDVRPYISSGATNGPTFRAFAYDTDSFFEVNNNGNNSANITLYRSDSATMFSIDGHSGTTYFAGNVGIGLGNPDYKLHVYDTATSNARILIQGTSNYALLQTTNSGGTIYIGIDNSSGTGFGTGAYSRVFYSSDNYPLVISTNGTERMRITGGGNIGIGTTNIGNKLVVNGGVSGTPSWDNNTIEVRAESGLTAAISLHRAGYTTAEIYSDNGAIAFRESGADRLRITSGNVGIGTTNPIYKLEVNGTSGFNNEMYVTGYSTYWYNGTTYFQATNSSNVGILKMTNNVSAISLQPDGGNVGIGTTSPSSKLDVNGYITTGDGNLELYKSYTVDMSNTGTYSTSNYYPVIIPIGTEPVLIQVQNNLNSNVPSWATHPAGFTLNVRWITNGSGWGTTQVKRKVQQYYENWASTTICGGITQMTQSSTEVIWLRGGGTYFFKLSRNFTPSPQASTYTSNGQSVSPTSTAQNTVWNAASGTENYYAGGIYAEMFYDANDNGYYLDPANISNLYTSYFGGVVGIGTTSVGSYPYGGKLNVNGNISTSGGKIGFGVTDAFTLNGIDTAHYGMSSNLNLVQLSGYYGLVFASTGVERMRITDGGNVGIGTTNPSARLHTLIDDNSFSPNVYIENTNTGTSALASIILKNASQNVASIYQQNANGDLGIYNSATTGNLNFFTNASNRMTILSGGNVGVGTSNPGYKLEVIGTTAVSSDLTMYGGSGYYLRLNGGTGALGYDSGNNQILSYTPADYTMWMGATKNLVSATIKGGITELIPQSQIESDYVSAISAQGSIITRAVAGASVVTSQLVTLNSSNQWVLADADSSTTSTRLLGVALNTAGVNEFLAVLLEGTYSTQTYHDQLNSPASPGAPIYISTTAGNVTQTAPTGTGKVVRLVGHNLYGTTGRAAAAVIRFKPDATWVEL